MVELDLITHYTLILVTKVHKHKAPKATGYCAIIILCGRGFSSSG